MLRPARGRVFLTVARPIRASLSAGCFLAAARRQVCEGRRVSVFCMISSSFCSMFVIIALKSYPGLQIANPRCECAYVDASPGITPYFNEKAQRVSFEARGKGVRGQVATHRRYREQTAH